MAIRWRVADCWICEHAGRLSLWEDGPGCYPPEAVEALRCSRDVSCRYFVVDPYYSEEDYPYTIWSGR